ncbi:MAG: O-antigen ligase family protein, partial [Planctomycetes bacterium]|nr:O-antigen ligase family protein [Planctomycetota bacterium]
PTIEASDAHAPRALSAEVRRGVLGALDAAATLGEKECRATAAHVHATRGVLRAALDERVGRALDTFLDAEALAFVRAHVTKRLDADDVERGSAEGPLGMPMPRGAIAALLSNAGLWAHGIFTVLTYHGAQNAQYSHYKAVLKFELCKLLFIPLVAIVCAIRDVRHVKLFVAAWAFGTLHLTMNAVTWWLQHGGRADNPGGQGGEANFLGAIIVTIAPVTYGLVLNGRTERARAAAVLVAGLFTLGILASGSRGALIALIAGGGYWLVHTNRKGLAAGGTMIAIACILVAAPIEFWQRMATIAGQSDRNPWVVQKEEESKHERTVLWALAVDLWREEPLWGIGPGNYTTVSAERTTFVDAYAGKRGLQAHNTWLQLLAEYGSIGAFVWAGAFFYAMMCYRRARKRLKGYSGWEWFPAMCLGLEAGALANAVTCTFNSFQWYDYHYWHFVFGPITLQVARETAERLDWLAPAPRA